MSSGTHVRFGKYGTTDALRGKVGSQSYLLDLLPSVATRAEALL